MSTTTNLGGVSRTFSTTSTVSPYICVGLNTSGEVIIATASTAPIGFTTREVVTAGDDTPIQLLNGGGTAFATAHGTITNAGTKVYTNASGKVSPTLTGGNLVGTALQSASANDVIEILLA